MNHGYLEEQNVLLVGFQCTGLGLREALDGLSVLHFFGLWMISRGLQLVRVLPFALFWRD